MSNAHKGSKLIIKDQLVPVDFSSAHFDFNRDATGIQYGNLIEPSAGAVYTIRPMEGKFGGGVAVETGATNLVLNPYFDANWGNSAFATKTLIDAPFIDGTTVKALKLVYSGSGDGYASRTITLSSTPNRTFTFSFWVKQIGNNVGLFSNTFLQFIKSAGYATVCSYSPSTVPTEWTKISITGTTPSDTTNNFNIILRPLNSATGEIWYTLPQVEEKSFPTSFVNGTRANGMLKYPKEILSTDEGCISFWMYARSDSNTFAGNPNPIFSSGIDGGFDLLIDKSGNNYLRAYSTSVISTQMYPHLKFDTWSHVVVYWKKNVELGIYVDGVLDVKSTSPTDWSNYYLNNGTGFYIGSGIRSNPNIILSDFKIDRKMPTAEDISIWYISGKPFYNPFDYRAYGY